MEKTEEKKFEELITDLETIVKELESGSEDLETSINKYTEAMKIVKICNDKLENATESVNKILKDNGSLEDFEISE